MEPTLLCNDNMTSQRLQEVKQQWSSFKQGHVFNWSDNLDAAQLTTLLEDVEQIDITEVNRVYSATVAHEEFEQNNKHSIKSFDNVTTFADSTPEQRQRWEQMGLSLISNNKVGVLLLAGGQASRLGCVLPKGMYDIGLPSHKSLYQLQVERSIRVATMAARANGKDSCTIPWYIMTSPATYEQTVKHFRDNSFFGLPEKNFFFFNQHMQPCLTPEGQIINESSGKIALAPNGNGGLYKALYTSGALADMKNRGLEYVSQYCVDNCLIRVADPVFVGFMNDMQADCAAKVVPKAYPEEPVGVMAKIDGKPGVVEYSELDSNMRYSRDENGQLVYNYSHICINNFSVDFLNRIAEKHLDALRFHIAKKKIPYANEQGEKTTPPKENGWKLEMFIFDAFQFSKKMVALEVDRDEEFSPLKNASGAPKDSPETCLADICRLHTKYITQAGGIVESSDGASSGSPLVEVSPLVSYGGEDLAPLVKGKTFNTPVEITSKLQQLQQQQQRQLPQQPQGIASC